MKSLKSYLILLSNHKMYFSLFIFSILLIIPLIIFGFFLKPHPAKKTQSFPHINSSHLSDYSAIKKTNNVIHISLHTDSGYLYKSSANGVDAAKNLINANPVLQNHGNLFPHNIEDTFHLEKVVKDIDDPYLKKQNIVLTNEHITFSQQIHGVPILGTQLIIHLRNGNEIYDISGTWVTNQTIAEQHFSDDYAKEEALKQAKKNTTDTESLVIAKTQQMIINLGVLGNSLDDKNYPTLNVAIESREIPPLFSTEYFVSLTTGEIIFSKNNIHELLEREIYDCEKNPKCSKKLVRSEGNPPSGISDADTTYDLFEEIYDYFKTRYNRDSLDNKGLPLKAYVNLGNQFCPNAAWHEVEMLFCPGMARKDIAAHELTHGIVQHTINLIPYYQSLSLNESLADFFASAIDKNWTLGEGSPIGIVRNMENPPSISDTFGPQPDRLFSPYYYCGTNDIGGGHHNDGVTNKAFYLMTEGGSFNGCTFQGIGREKAEAIVYRTMNAQYLPTNANFYDLYAGLLKSCDDLFKASSDDCENVKKALQSTEIDQQAIGYAIGASCGGDAYPAYPPECRSSIQKKNSPSQLNSPPDTNAKTATPESSLTGLSIHTDKSEYSIDDTIHVCYKVPKSDYVEIVNILPGDEEARIVEGVDEGQGDCFDAVVNQPSGQQCLKILYGHSDIYSAETCFTVKEHNTSSPKNSLGKKGISPVTNPFDGTQDEKIYYECHDAKDTALEGGKQLQVSGLICERM